MFRAIIHYTRVRCLTLSLKRRARQRLGSFPFSRIEREPGPLSLAVGPGDLEENVVCHLFFTLYQSLGSCSASLKDTARVFCLVYSCISPHTGHLVLPPSESSHDLEFTASRKVVPVCGHSITSGRYGLRTAEMWCGLRVTELFCPFSVTLVFTDGRLPPKSRFQKCIVCLSSYYVAA